MSTTNIYFYIGNIVLVMTGWFFVHLFSVWRDKDKEHRCDVRVRLDKIYESIHELKSIAIDTFGTKAGSADRKKNIVALKLLLAKIESQTGLLQQVDPSFTAVLNTKFVSFRQALSEHKLFDSQKEDPIEFDDEIHKNISSSGFELYTALEDQYCKIK